MAASETKPCARCKTVLPLAEFRLEGKNKDYPRSWCRPCDAAYAKERWDKNKDAMSQRYKETSWARLYGITPEQYGRLLGDQHGRCAICDQECNSGRALAVDHDHDTGKVRGLLCGNCNKGLGNFKDSLYLLREAEEYLRAHEQ